MKFLADIGISPRSVAFLRSLGHDAIHLHEEGLAAGVVISVSERQIRARSLPIGK